MSELDSLPLETKVLAVTPQPAAVAALTDEVMRTFETFREANDRRLQEIETRMAADVLTIEKVDRINRALDEQKSRLDELALKAHRPPLEVKDPAQRAGAASEYKKAFNLYVRKGEASGLAGLEQKGLSAGSDPDGGYLVPDEIETTIGTLLREGSPLRAIATVQQMSSSLYKKPFAISGAATGWVGEKAARPETAAPALAELQFPAREIYAMPAATPTLLEDAAVDINLWLAQEVEATFAEQETDAFLNGDGAARPQGILSYPQVADSKWSWGNIGCKATGVAGGFAQTAPANALIDLVYAVKSGYRQNGCFVMNRLTQSEIRKLTDDNGDYLWQPSVSAGNPATLLGFPITEAEAMPDIADGAAAIAFGDFRRGYLILDRVGIRVLRDPYSAKPYVLFYTTKRVGGGVQNFEAIKLLKFSAA